MTGITMPKEGSVAAQSEQQSTEPNGLTNQQQSKSPQQGQQRSGSSTMIPGLQEQITQALQPLMGNLQQQVAQAVEQQRAATGRSRADPGAAASESSQAGASGRTHSSLQQAFAQAKTGMQEAVEWVVRLAHTIYDTVRAWLQRISAALSKMMVSLAFAGAKSAARPVLKAVVNKGVGALQERSQSTLKSVGRGATSPLRGQRASSGA
jgi:hypothetical protein